MLQFRPEVETTQRDPRSKNWDPAFSHAPAQAVPARGTLLEFGPFQLDATTGSLYLNGEFVTLTPKAIDTLRVLVEDAGRVVTKDEILERVWPNAFVEEGSIANNISTLRKLLNPHFEGDGPIATVARRGYRFTAPVHVSKARPQIALVADSYTDVSAVAPAKTEPKSLGEFGAVALRPKPQAPGPKPPEDPQAGRFGFTAIAAIVIAIVLGGIGYAAVMQVATLAAADAPPAIRPSVAVLPMKNLSGDASQAWLSSALSETISAELAGHQFRVVSGDSVVRMQRERNLPPGVGLTRKQLDEIGRDLASDLILTGNYLVVGKRIRVDVRLDEVSTGDAVASASVTDSADRFLDIVTRAGSELRTALGLDQPTTSEADALRTAFSVHPEALRHYFQGLEAMRLRDGPRARQLLTASIGADGNFALAHSALSTTWRLLGYDSRGADAAKRAFDLSARLSPEDRMSVEAQHHEASGSFPQAIELYRSLWKLYPDNIEYGLKLGNAQWLGGRAKDTLVTAEEMRRLPERDSRDPRIDLLEATAADVLADYPRATSMAARAAGKAAAAGAKLMLARARIKQGIYAVRVGKFDEGAAFFAEAETLFGEMGEAGGVADALRWQGYIATDRLRLEEAVKFYDRAYAIAAPLNYVRLTALIQNSQSSVARLQGDFRKAALLAEGSLATARDARDRTAQANALSTLGVALRMQGDYPRARDAYQRAAALAGEIGEVRSRSSAINSSAVIDFLTGDLAAARQKFEMLLAADRKMGAASGVALKLNNLSRVLALQDELVEAEELNAEECRAYEALKSAVNIAWCRARLAGIWIELGRTAEAVALVKTVAIKDFGASALAPLYIARLARAQVALGQTGPAADTIAAAEKLQASVGVNEEQSIHISVIRAEVEAAEGRRAAAIERLKKARADADRLGLTTWSLDAGLVLSRLDPREAAATERAAREAGFTFVARKARALAASTS